MLGMEGLYLSAMMISLLITLIRCRLLAVFHKIVTDAFRIEILVPNRIGWPVIAFDGIPEAFQWSEFLRQRVGQLIRMGRVGVEAVQEFFFGWTFGFHGTLSAITSRPTPGQWATDSMTLPPERSELHSRTRPMGAAIRRGLWLPCSGSPRPAKD